MLAIIIPYYKLTFFEATLQSLLAQTDRRFKVYIGDDASPEKPHDLLEKYKGKFEFVYYRFEDNLGGISLVKQWERCIALTNDEEWLMILGDDDVLGDNVVTSFYENYDEVHHKNIKLIRFASKYIDSQSNGLSGVYYHPIIERTTDSYFKHFQMESRSSMSEYIFKRESFNNLKFTNYPLAWHSDDKAWLDFTNCGFIYTMNDAIIKVRLSTENISGKVDNFDKKNQARRMFLKDIITKKKYNFKKEQKTIFLFEYGMLIIDQKQLSLNNIMIVLFQFLKMGSVYDGLRFLRRMYRTKF